MASLSRCSSATQQNPDIGSWHRKSEFRPTFFLKKMLLIAWLIPQNFKTAPLLVSEKIEFL